MQEFTLSNGHVARLKPRNGKVLISYQGIYWTEEAFEQVYPKQYAEMFQTAGV